ncbi:hypothetical protein F2Q69_00001501 [Brassica cretica]|uniref:Uncharacterized protein n=2 Tax=Brassica cretica TaxID=69181 RepID=A0A8S9PB71_BRACR|nr:hypothetical protein F2Q69_00001501 [Brassica cretica]KAF3543895.1 hypothetical protein DY000_02001715 [Brassica cretica]
MIRIRLICLIVLLFTLVFVSSKATRIHAAETPNFFSGPSRGDRELLHSYATRVIGSGGFKPEKRKIPTGSNHLHNKR